MVGIIYVINNKYKDVSKYFENEIKEEFNKNYKKLYIDLLSYQLIYNKTIVNHRVYFMSKQLLDFNEVLVNFNLLESYLDYQKKQ